MNSSRASRSLRRLFDSTCAVMVGRSGVYCSCSSPLNWFCANQDKPSRLRTLREMHMSTFFWNWSMSRCSAWCLSTMDWTLGSEGKVPTSFSLTQSRQFWRNLKYSLVSTSRLSEMTCRCLVTRRSSTLYCLLDSGVSRRCW
ncbi:unnamed protein product [Ixodes persulcatus]